MIIVQLNQTELRAIISEEIKAALSAQQPTTDIPKPSTDGFFRMNDLVKLFKVSKPTLIEWNKTGKLPAVRIGHGIYYPKTEIDKMLTKGISKRGGYVMKGA